MRARRNLATAIGGWSVRHRGVAILGWLMLVVAAIERLAGGHREAEPLRGGGARAA